MEADASEEPRSGLPEVVESSAIGDEAELNDEEDEPSADVAINDEEDDDSTSFNLEDEQELTDEERVQLYEKGLRFKTKQSYKHALLCFLGCIKGIQQDTRFSFLPNCLQNIASIYAKFEDFPKAVQFMQAAKLYYETALIGTHSNESEEEEKERYHTMDDNAVEADAKRANEYEKLSHDCLMEKNVPLALEYCGKATQLRRKVYGENHPVTIKSLDLFTMIYAEMGKLQYSDAVKKLDEKVEDVGKEPVLKKKVRFEDDAASKDEKLQQKQDKESSEEESTDDNAEKESKTNSSSNKFSTSKQMILIFLISSLLAVLSTFAFCSFTKNEACPSYDYVFERVKFHYYYYIKSLFTDNNYI